MYWCDILDTVEVETSASGPFSNWRCPVPECYEKKSPEPKNNINASATSLVMPLAIQCCRPRTSEMPLLQKSPKTLNEQDCFYVPCAVSGSWSCSHWFLPWASQLCGRGFDSVDCHCPGTDSRQDSAELPGSKRLLYNTTERSACGHQSRSASPFKPVLAYSNHT